MTELAELQIRNRFDYEGSAGAERAAADLIRLGDAADNAQSRTSVLGRSFNSVNRSLDENAKAASKAAAAARLLAQQQAAVQQEVAAGLKPEAAAALLERAEAAYARTLANIERRRAAEAEMYAASSQGATAASEASQNAAQYFSAAQREVNALIATGRLSSDELAKSLNRAAAAYRATAEAARSAAQAQRPTTQAQRAAEQFAGVRPTNRSQDDAAFVGRADDIAAYGNALDRARAEVDDVFASSQRYAASLEKIEQAQRVGAISAQRSAQLQSQLTAAYATSNAPLSEHNALVRAAKVAEDAQAAATKASAAALVKLREELVPLAAAERRFAEEVNKATGAERAGIITANESLIAQKRAKDALDQFTISNRNAGLSSAATGQQIGLLVPQIQDVVVSLQGGQMPLTVLLQQGTQITQIFGGVRQTFAAAFEAVGPFRLAMGGLGLVLTTLLTAYNSQQSRLADLRSTLRAVTADFATLAVTQDATARQISASGIGVSRDEANTVINRFRQAVPRGEAFDFTQATKDAADFARVMGIDVVAAADRLAQGLRDPAALVKELGEKNFETMGGQLRLTAELMTAGGARGDAYALVMGRLRAQFSDASKDIGPFATAMRELQTAWVEFKDAIGPGLAAAGKLVLDDLKLFFGEIKALVDTVKGLKDSVTGLFQGASTAPAAGAGSAGLDTFEQRLLDRENRQRNPRAVNQFGYSGLYQFGTAALQTAGVYEPSAGENLNTNQFTGRFKVPGFPGVQTREDFLNSEAAQREAFKLHIDKLNGMLNRIPGAENFNRAGLLATAHGYGVGATSQFIRDGGKSSAVDGNRVGLEATYKQFAETVARTTETAQVAVAEITVSAAKPMNLMLEAGLRIARGEQGGLNPLSSVETQRRQIDDNRNVIGQALASPGLSTPDTEALTRALEAQRVAYEGTLTAAERMVRTDRERAGVLSQLDPVQRELTAAVQEYRDAQRASGKEADPAKEAGIMAARLSVLQAEYKGVTNAAILQAESADRVAAAYGRSSEAGRHQESVERALVEVRRSGVQGDQAQAQAAELLARQYDRVTQSSALRAQAEQNRNGQDELAVLAKEAELIGATAEARERELAVFRARQVAERAGIGGTDAAKEAEALAGRIAEVRAQNAQTASSFQALSNIGVNAFESVGNAITDALVNGNAKAIDFGNIFKGVIASIVKQLAQLAIINPILNSLFGGSRDTLGSALGAVGGLFGGGGSSGGGLLSGILGFGAAAVGAFSSSSPTNRALSQMGGQYGPATSLQVAQAAPQPGGGVGLGEVGAVGSQLLKVGGIAETAYKFLGGSLGEGVAAGLGDFSGTISAFGSLATDAITSTISTFTSTATATNQALNALGAGVQGVATAAEVGAAVASNATNIALNSLGNGVQGVATATQVGTAAVVDAVGLAGTAATSATSVISQAIPYIGTIISVVSALAQGNFKGAALMATGAAVGAAIGVWGFGVGAAIGAAIGAVVGGIVDMFTNAPPENPYQSVGVTVQDGQLARGDVVSQIEDPSNAVTAVESYATAINAYLKQARLEIALENGRIGGVGRGVEGFEQVDAPSKLFNKLLFKPDQTVNPESNYYKVASSGLLGEHYESPTELQAALVSFATFADQMDAAGLVLESVAKDFKDIRIKKVLGVTSPTAQAYLDERDAPQTNDFRTALSNSLPGQTFADMAALDAAIVKVNNFVNGTIPSLLNPVFALTSSITEQSDKIRRTYGEAIQQANEYGLATDKLAAAQGRALAQFYEPYQAALDAQEQTIRNRRRALDGSPTTAREITEFNFDTQAKQQRDALSKSMTDVYGEGIKVNGYFARQMANLEETLAAERLDTMRKFDDQVRQQAEQQAAAMRQAMRAQEDAQYGVDSMFWSIRGRQSAATGDNQSGELAAFNFRSIQERTAYARQLVDFYGESFAATQDYQSRLNELETAQGYERLQIIKKYADAAVDVTGTSAAEQARLREQAQGNVANVIGGLTEYARRLQTSQDSPLSATAQYDLARSQFLAVQGAAAAGDYNSVTKLQGFSDAFLTASRGVNGSGEAFARDFGQVIGALEGVAKGPVDALTNSAMLEAQREQTVALSVKFDELRAELVAVRRELAQQTRREAA